MFEPYERRVRYPELNMPRVMKWLLISVILAAGAAGSLPTPIHAGIVVHAHALWDVLNRYAGPPLTIAVGLVTAWLWVTVLGVLQRHNQA
jgi:hypothetical protein